MSLNAPEHFKTPARPTIARREVLVPQKRTLNGTRGNETESTLMLSHNDHHIRNLIPILSTRYFFLQYCVVHRTIH